MLDFEVIGTLAVLLISVTQILKYHAKFNAKITPFFTGGLGIVLSLLWYLVNGRLETHHAPLRVDWINLYQACASACVAVTTAAAGFLAQKMAPIPNLLPTSSEINQGKLDSVLQKQQSVVDAVEKGMEPQVAKDIVGLPKDEPPPNEILEEIQPVLPEPKPAEGV